MRAVALLAIVLTSILAADSGAGIHWTVPSNWKSEGDRPMRLATYQIPPDGECAVYYFGQGQGGSVEANIDRWKGQFDGSKDTPKVEKRSIHGLKVTTLDVSGAYTGMQGPPKQDYRLLGAIVEGPQGSIFFKLAGPMKTVSQNQSAFEKMLSTLTL